MNKLKITIAAALLMCGTTVFAGNPKTDDAKTDAKTEVKATPSENEGAVKTEDATFTYYVTAEETINGVPKYDVSTTDPGCTGSSKPCEVLSTEQMDGQGRISQSSVTDILSHRD